MCADFQLHFRHSAGNLHVHTTGGFDGDSAHELINLFRNEYKLGGRVFVDTADLGEIFPSGRAMMDAELGTTEVPPASLYFKGEKGFQVAPNGSRVLIRRKNVAGAAVTSRNIPRLHKCSGHCSGCASCQTTLEKYHK